MSEKRNLSQREFRDQDPEAWRDYVEMVLAQADDEDEYLITPKGELAFIHNDGYTGVALIRRDGKWQEADWDDIEMEELEEEEEPD